MASPPPPPSQPFGLDAFPADGDPGVTDDAMDGMILSLADTAQPEEPDWALDDVLDLGPDGDLSMDGHAHAHEDTTADAESASAAEAEAADAAELSNAAVAAATAVTAAETADAVVAQQRARDAQPGLATQNQQHRGKQEPQHRGKQEPLHRYLADPATAAWSASSWAPPPAAAPINPLALVAPPWGWSTPAGTPASAISPARPADMPLLLPIHHQQQQQLLAHHQLQQQQLLKLQQQQLDAAAALPSTRSSLLQCRYCGRAFPATQTHDDKHAAAANLCEHEQACQRARPPTQSTSPASARHTPALSGPVTLARSQTPQTPASAVTSAAAAAAAAATSGPAARRSSAPPAGTRDVANGAAAAAVAAAAQGLERTINNLDMSARLCLRDALVSLSNKASNPNAQPTPEQEAMNRAAEYLVLRMLFLSGQQVAGSAPGTPQPQPQLPVHPTAPAFEAPQIASPAATAVPSALQQLPVSAAVSVGLSSHSQPLATPAQESMGPPPILPEATATSPAAAAATSGEKYGAASSPATPNLNAIKSSVAAPGAPSGLSPTRRALPPATLERN
jgi:hypothetical protein